MMRARLLAALALVATSNGLGAQQPAPLAPAPRTKIVFLGTGNPAPTPERMGPGVAIVVNGTPYLVDAGVGVVRRAAAANRAGVKGLEMPNLKTVFLTHLHSDHTIGLPDLVFTPWIMRRTAPLAVYGPTGTSAMMTHILAAWSADNDIRINGLEKGNTTGNKVNVHEILPGVVFQDANVKVTAFYVKHGSWKQAFGYRFDTPDRSIVISGDGSPSESIAQNCHGCDVLIHEAYSQRGYDESSAAWQRYSKSFHTTTYELAELATKARPRLLILYHQMYFGGPKDTEAGMLAEISSRYKGRVVSARDLDVY
ncbi:MAG: MBL fold metallo-hydrolase [bacterium]